MKIHIHRGTHEIGGSCVEVASGAGRLVLDLGMPLVKKGTREAFEFGAVADLPGPELVRRGILPDVRGLYSWDKARALIDAVVVSHAHADHYGLASYVRDEVPIYASEGTAALIRVSAAFLPHHRRVKEAVILPKWQPRRIGPFTVTGHLVDHAAPDALALEVEAEGRKVFYSGDLRATGRKAVLFTRMLEHPPRNVDVLLLEGTMLGRPGRQAFADEAAVERALTAILRKKTNLALLFCSSQNLDRLCSAFRAVKRTNGLFVIDLYTAFVLHELRGLSDRIPQFDTPGVRVKFWKWHADRLAEAGRKDFLYAAVRSRISVEEIVARRRKVLMVAKQNRLFQNVTRQLPALDGLEMIWSMWPGYLTGDDVVSEFCARHQLEPRIIHTSGHATVEDLQALARAIRPKRLVPIHTFEAAQFPDRFANVLIVQDGEDLAV